MSLVSDGGRLHRSEAARPTAALAAVLLLSVTTALPGEGSRLAALLVIIGLGVPHGALDGEIGRDLLRPRFGHLWFPVFAVPYLTLSAAVLAGWRLVPLLTLGCFLLASVWHFGSEEAEGRSRLEQIVRGGLPIAVPSLLHPAATAALFSVVTGQFLVDLPPWLIVASWLWLAAASFGVVILFRRSGHAALVIPAILVACFAALPPLTAFAIYFVGVHAPAHVAALIRSPTLARRVRDRRAAVVRAIPLTLLTLALGAALWPFYAGDGSDRLLALTIQGLAALTLPHMILDHVAEPVSHRLQTRSRLASAQSAGCR